jgi:hypothetical protein
MSLYFSKHAKERLEQRAGPDLSSVLIGLFSLEGPHRKVFFQGTLSSKRKKNKKNWSYLERHVLVCHKGRFYVTIEDVVGNKVITFLTEELYIRKSWGLNLSFHKEEILNRMAPKGAVYKDSPREGCADLVVESSKGSFSIDFKHNKKALDGWREDSLLIPARVAFLLVRDFSDVLGEGPLVIKKRLCSFSTSKETLERIASFYRKKVN